MARIAGTRVVQVAQQSCFAGGALAVEGADSVVARGTVEARGHGAIVDVFRAVSARPAVHTDA